MRDINVNQNLENLKKKYQQKYGVAVFDVEAKNTNSGVEIKGEVLTENQRDDIIASLGNKKIKKVNIKVLSDANERNEIGWASVKKSIVDLKSRFVSSKILNKKILARIRCSQAQKGEILRVLFKNEDQLLVQQSDLTLGWLNGNEVVLKKKNLSKRWNGNNFALKNKALNLRNIKFKKKSVFNCHSELVSESIIDFKKDNSMQDNQKVSKMKTRQDVNQRQIPEMNSGQALKQVQDDNIQKKILKEAEKYLGMKYVLGGKSKKGIDCSGFIQVVYKNSLGIILPKHSWDQKKIGKKIKLDDVESGDLVFLVKKRNNHKHVGIAEVVERKDTKILHSPKDSGTMEPANKKINLIHASFDKKRVVRQGLKEVLKNYDFVEARRIIE